MAGVTLLDPCELSVALVLKVTREKYILKKATDNCPMCGSTCMRAMTCTGVRAIDGVLHRKNSITLEYVTGAPTKPHDYYDSL